MHRAREFFAACLLLLALALPAAGAEAPLRCVVCQTLVSGPFYWYQPAGSTVRQPVCEACSKLDRTCAICRLPLRSQGRQLEDGRWLCDQDFGRGVFSAAEARRLYEAAFRELQSLLAGTGTLPRDNISVALVDGRELRTQNASLPSEHEEQGIMGLTRTRRSAAREFQHQILLINGLSPARLAAVCAHEYTHAWIHENVPPERKLERDTVEGFCELVAYKLMTQRGEDGEKAFILANAYTRGQVNAFVQAETEHHFLRIVSWLKTGVNEVMSAANARRALAPEHLDVTVPPWPPPALFRTAVPDALVLKGISGNQTRRYALINDCTLATNEEGRVRVGQSNLVVRCLEIRKHSALIRVQGDLAPRELFLGSTD